MDIVKLKEELDKLDLPNLRLDLTKVENIRWLLRNISVRNKEVGQGVINGLINLLKESNNGNTGNTKRIKV